MPNLSPLTINDGKDTPESWVFNPDNIDPKTGVATLVKSTGLTPIGDANLSMSRRLTQNKYRLRVRLSVPKVVTETINGVNVEKVIHASFADVNFTFPDTTSEAERKDVVALMGNLLTSSDTLVTGVLIDLNGIYG